MNYKASAIAHPNIALIKYFGKRNIALNLPTKSSISVIMSNHTTITTVEFSESYKTDEIYFNGSLLTNTKEQKKYKRHLDLIRKQSNIKNSEKLKAKIYSNSDFPFGTGLAASSSIFASLTLAALEALKIPYSKKMLSIISRQGSGSSTRSIFDGFNIWYKGSSDDVNSSFSEQFMPPENWPDFCMISLITTSKIKKVSSRDGMIRAKNTSPFYDQWLEESTKDFDSIQKAIKNKDFSLVGQIAERNCIQMHTVAFTSKPPIIYWNDITLEIIHEVIKLREEGLECYFTIDAGPQVVILCRLSDKEQILKRISSTSISLHEVVTSIPGKGARITTKHLF